MKSFMPSSTPAINFRNEARSVVRVVLGFSTASFFVSQVPSFDRDGVRVIGVVVLDDEEDVCGDVFCLLRSKALLESLKDPVQGRVGSDLVDDLSDLIIALGRRNELGELLRRYVIGTDVYLLFVCHSFSLLFRFCPSFCPSSALLFCSCLLLAMLGSTELLGLYER